MSEEQTISVREHLELMIRQERELRLADSGDRDKALELQASKYEGRLVLLDERLSRIERQQAMIAGGLALLVILMKFVPANLGLVP